MGRIIEDDADLNKVLAFNLREAGHDPLSALRAVDGLRLAEQEAPDLVVLDLMLPDLPGTEVCRRLKQGASTRMIPVLILTARGEEVDRVVGFELGAEDYVVKPFSLRELLLRIQVILQRHQGAGPERQVESGLLRVDQAAHRVWVGKREVELTPLEYRLLLLLYERRDSVQSRTTLLEDVWGAPGQSSRTVDTHITRLREKLGRAGRYIQTVRGIGYRFTVSGQE